MRITSAQNATVKFVRALHQRSYRRQHGMFIAEGVRLVREALAAHWPAPLVLVVPEELGRTPDGSGLLAELPVWAERCLEVSPAVLDRASATDSPPGVLAVLRLPPPPVQDALTEADLGLVLDRIADPGNAGTMLRTADAFGAGYVVSLAGGVDLFAPKVVRAGMGAHFHLPIYDGLSWETMRLELQGVPLVALDAQAEQSLPDFKWPRPCALLVGSEAHGLSGEVAGWADIRVRIPMRRQVESLNVAVATAIALYVASGPSRPEAAQRYT